MEENMTKTQGRARAELVRQERTKRCWPQAQLADIADVSLRTIQRLEKDGIAALETLKAVASAFEVDVEQLSPLPKTPPQKNENGISENGVHLLSRLKSGKDLTDIIGGLDGEDSLQHIYDQINDKKAVDQVAAFFEFLASIAINWNTLRPGSQLQFEFDLLQELRKLEVIGFHVFGIKREVRNTDEVKIKMSTIFIVPSDYPKIAKNEKLNREFVPAVLSNIARSPNFSCITEVLRPQDLSRL